MTGHIYTMIGGLPQQDVTSVTLANNTAKTVDVPVPTNKRWQLLGVRCTNPDNVNRAVTIDIYKEAAGTNQLRRLASNTLVASGAMQWPRVEAAAAAETSAWALVVLTSGNIIRVTWAAGGASAGGTDADGLIVEYLEYYL